MCLTYWFGTYTEEVWQKLKVTIGSDPNLINESYDVMPTSYGTLLGHSLEVDRSEFQSKYMYRAASPTIPSIYLFFIFHISRHLRSQLPVKTRSQSYPLGTLPTQWKMNLL